MRKYVMALTLALLSTTVVFAQPRYDYKQLTMEKLDRGVVAVPMGDGRVMVSWRLLSDDHAGQAFNILRNGETLNENPLRYGGTCFIDEHPLGNDSDVRYAVEALPPNLPTVQHYNGPPLLVPTPVGGEFLLKAGAPVGYIPVPLQKPEGGQTPDGRRFQYSANDASVGDMDGDGQYEIILKWEPSNAHDNAHAGYTGPTLLDCYKINRSDSVNGSSASSHLLWRIDLGRNIRSGAHYVPFIVYDLDGDGKAEMMVRTSDGTRDGTGAVIGDSTADYREKSNPRTIGRILTGMEYITVFDGLTGRALCSKPYIPQRGQPQDWGDDNANRSDRFLAALGYFGGKNASAVFCRGYYTRSVLTAWDWDGTDLKERWTFDTDHPQWRDYAGQGNHNLRVADVDGDGYDEITYGAMAVDHDGTGLYNTGFGHGDAIHLVAEPKTNRLFIWDCHENRRDGSELRDAATGEVIFQIKSNSDVGRAMAADIDPTNRGVEMWSVDSHGIRSMTGDVVSTASDPDDPKHDNSLVLGGRYLPVNFGIWWDGDLLRELLDHETVTKYNWDEKRIDTVQHFDGARFNNGSKSNPCLQADILGDWREEVIVRNQESTELRIYTTTIPTDFRINCLMQDIPYRLSVVYQNVGYNQPPEAGFYIGTDCQDYLK